MNRDPRIDDYIERQAEFARPILATLREVVHEACPEVEETIKWSMPAFTYKGHPLAHMAGFKAHASFGFWRGSLVLGEDAQKDAMGQFGRLTSVGDLPPRDALHGLVRKAAELTDGGVKPQRVARPKPELETPADLASALAANSAAAATFDSFSPSARRDYVEWVIGAKREETRARRVEQAVLWMAEGKKRHWKYENC